MTATPAAGRVVVLVDDVRRFRDDRPCRIARSSAEALELLPQLLRVDELWLDYELGGGDTILPVVEWLERQATAGHPLDVGRIYVHTSLPAGAVELMRRLTGAGYVVERHHTQRFWTW